MKSYRQNGYGFYVLELKDDNKTPIGTCGLIKREQLDYADVGFALLPEFEGRGFGFESSTAVLWLAKNNFRLEKLLAIALPSNTKSIKLIKKLGFKLEKKTKLFDDDDELLLFAKCL